MSELPGVTERDIDTLARTLWGEAESGDRADLVAIAWVARNRAALPNWPDRVAAVCLQTWQFSAWNKDNPRLTQMQEATVSDPWFRECRTVAEGVLRGTFPDTTSRSTHYYATWAKMPKWAKGKVPVYETPGGRYNHLFFNDIDTPPPQTAAEALSQERPLAQTRTMQGASLAGIGGTVAATAGIVSQVAPALPVLDWFKDNLGFGLMVLGVAVLAGVGYIAYARWQDRKAGLR